MAPVKRSKCKPRPSGADPLRRQPAEPAGAVRDVLREDRVHAWAKGRFYATGAFGRKQLGFDSDAEVELGR